MDGDVQAQFFCYLATLLFFWSLNQVNINSRDGGAASDPCWPDARSALVPLPPLYSSLAALVWFVLFVRTPFLLSIAHLALPYITLTRLDESIILST